MSKRGGKKAAEPEEPEEEEEDAEDVEETSNHLIEDIAAPLDQEGAAGWITLGSKFTHGRSTSTPIIQCE